MYLSLHRQGKDKTLCRGATSNNTLTQGNDGRSVADLKSALFIN